MSDRLFEKYFPQEDERETEALRDEWQGTIAKLATLVAAPGWAVLRERFSKLVQQADIRPGSEQEMLYQIGRKDGLKSVQDLFATMETELRAAYSARD